MQRRGGPEEAEGEEEMCRVQGGTGRDAFYVEELTLLDFGSKTIT